MKKLVMLTRMFFVVMALMFIAVQSMACEFSFKVNGDAKTEYSVGDELVVVVTLHLTHRVCPEGLDATKFDFSGLKVLGATKWAEVKTGEYERKFKIQVIADEKAKYSMSAVRTCDKDGGSGSFKVKVNGQ